jgi:rhodanese-related sulfurtransferase
MVSPADVTDRLKWTPLSLCDVNAVYAFAALSACGYVYWDTAVPDRLQKRRDHVNNPILQIETMDVAEVATQLRAGKLLLIDVREPAEFASERIAQALLYPLSTFDASSLPDDGVRKVVFHCGSGKRSFTAAEHRLAAGQRHAAHMGGGIAAWKAAGLPVIAPVSSL